MTSFHGNNHRKHDVLTRLWIMKVNTLIECSDGHWLDDSNVLAIKWYTRWMVCSVYQSWPKNNNKTVYHSCGSRSKGENWLDLPQVSRYQISNHLSSLKLWPLIHLHSDCLFSAFPHLYTRIGKRKVVLVPVTFWPEIPVIIQPSGSAPALISSTTFQAIVYPSFSQVKDDSPNLLFTTFQCALCHHDRSHRFQLSRAIDSTIIIPGWVESWKEIPFLFRRLEGRKEIFITNRWRNGRFFSRNRLASTPTDLRWGECPCLIHSHTDDSYRPDWWASCQTDTFHRLWEWFPRDRFTTDPWTMTTPVENEPTDEPFNPFRRQSSSISIIVSKKRKFESFIAILNVLEITRDNNFKDQSLIQYLIVV